MPKKLSKPQTDALEAAIKSELREAAAPTVQKEVEYVGETPVPTFYANNASLKATYWDMRIDWGLILDKGEKRTTVQPQAATIMSWAHAKVLAALIVRLIENYEKQFGEIKLPKGRQILEESK